MRKEFTENLYLIHILFLFEDWSFSKSNSANKGNLLTLEQAK